MDARPVPDAPPGFDALLRASRIALFLDFDGTLVDLAARPDAIDVPAGLASGLAELSDRLEGRLALVSGRGIPDLERYLGQLAVARAGSHGIARVLADGATLGDEAQALPEEAVEAIEAFAAEHGFVLETKPHGAALHYRASPDLEALGLEFASALAEAHALQVKRGKSIVELVRRGADKGGAVRAFMAVPPFAGSVPVFVGDDVTDEDGFAAAEDFGGFGVLVGGRAPTRACYALSGTVAVHEWLGL